MIHTPRNLLVENKLRVSVRPKHPHPIQTQRPLRLPFAATGGPSDLTSWDNASWEEGTREPSKPPSSWNSYDQSSSSGSSGKLPFVAAITGVALFSFLLGRQLTDYRRYHYREELSKQPIPLESVLADIPNNNDHHHHNDIDKSQTAEDQGAIFTDDDDDDGNSGGIKMAHGGLHLEKEFKQAMTEAPQQQPSSSSSTTAAGETALRPQQPQQQQEGGDLQSMDQGGVMQSEVYQEDLHAMDQDISTTSTGGGGYTETSISSSSRLPLRSPEAEENLQKAQEKEIRRLHLYDRLQMKQEREKARSVRSAGATGQVGMEGEREGEEGEKIANENEAKEVQALARGMTFEALQKRAMQALAAATKASVAAKRASESAALSTDAAAQSAFAARRAMRASARAAGALEIRSQEQVQAAYKEAKEAERASEQAAQSAAVSAAHVLMSERDAKSSSRVATAAADMSEPHGVLQKIQFQWMKLCHAVNVRGLRGGGNDGSEGEDQGQVEAAVVDSNKNKDITSADKKGKGGSKGGHNEDEEVVGITKKRRRWLRVR